MAEQKRYRSAKIDVVANGFVVTIGCQTVVAETAQKLKEMIVEYLDDPQAAEKKLLLNSMRDGDVDYVNTSQTPASETVIGQIERFGGSTVASGNRT